MPPQRGMVTNPRKFAIYRRQAEEASNNGGHHYFPTRWEFPSR